jgi:hypothetical protein
MRNGFMHAVSPRTHGAHRGRVSLLRDLRRDWRCWSRAERLAAPVILGGLIAATLPVLWLIAQ